ncbi:hypothetical protein BO85DRAFT_431185 [Aspergillus piperis CBS 112811]|uniref:DUF7587 domain-containing protein n=1 Tax=Aspergillus piperis CBS 112811 TaxID=1448313 RepID=A0A8G1QW78_9EURO|nr:hypothetical protein BO85DRAFT_431185 [Aspergillus piperis CBS 112811]RAH52525.1 hypothetical protein BO85DRAFT_431185 [Aspergillus piperis CBS 112811]
MVRYSYPEWREVQQHTSEGHWRWIPTLGRIRRTARSLGLHIVPNYVDDGEETCSHQQSLAPQVEISEITPQHTSMIQHPERRDDGITEMQEQASVPVPEIVDMTQIDISLCSGGDKVCFWCVQEQILNQKAHKESNTVGSRSRWTDEVPPVIYRWSNIDSQGVNSKMLFLAGLFADGRQFFTPGDISQEEFINYFSRHVHIDKTPSPFISTFRSMLSPVHRALWNKEGAIISIIDTHKLDTDVYPAIKLFREQNLRIRGYDGRGEFLLADEHAEIGQFLQLDKLASHKYNRKQLHGELARDAGKLDHTSGYAIGKFLNSINLPFEFSREVSEGLFHSWRLKRQGTWESFHEGVCAGYDRSIPSTSVSEVRRPESIVHDISDDDSITECGSIAEDENMSDGESEDIGASSPCMGRELAAHTSERKPLSTPDWFFMRDTDDELITDEDGEEEEVTGRQINLFSEQDSNRSAELITDWPEEATQVLSSLNLHISQTRIPTIEIFDPKTGGWVQEQARLAQKMEEDDCQSYMQPPSSDDTQEMRGISVEGESDIMHDTETRYSILSMSRELSEDVLPHIRFVRDRERRRRWLLQ